MLTVHFIDSGYGDTVETIHWRPVQQNEQLFEPILAGEWGRSINTKFGTAGMDGSGRSTKHTRSAPVPFHI